MTEWTTDAAQDWLRNHLKDNQWAQPTSSGAVIVPSKLGEDAPGWDLIVSAMNALAAKGEIAAEAVNVQGQNLPSHFKGVKLTAAGFLGMQS